MMPESPEPAKAGASAPFFTLSLSCCNIAPYLGECFDSILSQSFGDWECVVWLEDSDDGTEGIVNSFAGRDPRIRVFTGPRSGSGSVSRNKAIELARGEYVLFVDGDDLLAPDALRELHDGIARHPGADLYPGAVRKFRHGTGETLALIDNYPARLEREMTGSEATVLQSDFWPNPMLQLTVFRLGFLRDAGIKCVKGLRVEDMEFFPRALYLARRVVPLHKVHYLYRFRANSLITAQPDRPDRLHDDYSLVYRSLLAFYATVSQTGGFDHRVAAFWAKSWISRQMVCKWFRPAVLDAIPRTRRADTLHALFADGFAAFDRLRHAGDMKTRIAGWWIKLFVRHPAMRGCAELFFRTYHNALQRLASPP